MQPWWVKVMPVAQIVLCIGGSIGYLVAGDRRMALYWFFAACLTATMTFGK